MTAIDSNLDPIAVVSDIGTFTTLYSANSVTFTITAETFSDELASNVLTYTLVNSLKQSTTTPDFSYTYQAPYTFIVTTSFTKASLSLGPSGHIIGYVKAVDNVN